MANAKSDMNAKNSAKTSKSSGDWTSAVSGASAGSARQLKTPSILSSSPSTSPGALPSSGTMSLERLASTSGTGVCIVCKERRDGYPVKDDVVIHTVRAVKRTFGWATNNRLVVCESCVPAYKAKRGNFEKKLVQYGAIGAFLAILFTVLSRTLSGLLLSLLLGLFVAGLALFQYYPAAEVPVQAKAV